MSNQILIVEDDFHTQIILGKVMGRIGLDFIIKGQGDHAIEHLRTHTPALVLLDMHLPVVSGDGVLDYMRSTEHLTNTKVVVLSADIQMCTSSFGKADYVLMKPVRPRQIVALVQSILAGVIMV